MLAGLGRSYEPADLFSIEICFHALAYSFPIFVRAAHDLSKHNFTKVGESLLLVFLKLKTSFKIWRYKHLQEGCKPQDYKMSSILADSSVGQPSEVSGIQGVPKKLLSELLDLALPLPVGCSSWQDYRGYSSRRP